MGTLYCTAKAFIVSQKILMENIENQKDLTGTGIKEEFENIDNYQADLASILYYTKTFQQDDDYPLNRDIKEELNIEEYYEKHDFSLVEANFPQKYSDTVVLNYKSCLNTASAPKIAPIPESEDFVVKVDDDSQVCNFELSEASTLQNNSLNLLQKPKKLIKTFLDAEDSIKPNKKLLKKERKRTDACYKECVSCNYVSTDKDDWSRHQKSFHLRYLTCKCQLCEFNTNSTQKLRFHMNQHAKKVKFKCHHCTYETVLSSHLKRHINSTHSKSTKYPCRYCDFVATSFFSVRRHIEEEHEKIIITGKINSQNEPKVQRITEVLKVNDTKVVSRKEVLARRARIVKGEQFKCQYCEYQTPFSDYLNIHINSRHTQNILYKCQYCEYNATKSYTLRCHVNSKHTRKVLYKCELCNLETTRSNILKRHIERIHVKKSFRCQYCDYVAQKEGYIRNHLRRKHGIQFKTEKYNEQLKIESELIEIENVKFEPELVKSENSLV